jgi:hypothetical protein
MAITVTCGNVENGTGTIRATIDALHITADGLDVWNDDGTQKRYRFRLTAPSGEETQVDSGYSHLFAPSADGDASPWDGYIPPVPGEYTVRLHDEEEDEDVDTETFEAV